MAEGEIDAKTLRKLLDAFEASDWDELSVALPDGDSLQLSRDPDVELTPGFVAAAPAPHAAPRPPSAPAAAPTPPAATPTGEPGGVPVTSTTVGIFSVAPEPGEPPFVAVGSEVEAGEPIGIVRVLKLVNPVPAERSGVVTAILVEDGEPVEFGQPLVLVESVG